MRTQGNMADKGEEEDEGTVMKPILMLWSTQERSRIVAHGKTKAEMMSRKLCE